MTLPYDIARCHGNAEPLCSDCRRREPGREQWQTCIAPPIKDGKCDYYIPPTYRTTTFNGSPAGQ